MSYENDLILSRQWHNARNQIQDALSDLDECCVYTGMSTGESESNYYSVGFGSVTPTRCDFLFVVLTDNNIFMSIDDGVTWVNIFDPTAIGVALVGTSTVVEYGGDETDVPTGWLLCDGSEVSQATYADLYAEIGTIYGTAGSPGVDFVLPDLRGQQARGANSASYPNGANGSFATTNAGDSGGVETHQLVIADLPAHVHGNTQPANLRLVRAAAGNTGVRYAAGTTGTSTGGDTAHNNIAPVNVVNYIIKT